MIGTLLTALVVAREWERGTMEALMATPVSIQELVLGKLVPYFLLGLGSMLFLHAPLLSSSFGHRCVAQFCRSFWLPPCFSGGFGLGLWVSTLSKSQFVAGQFAVILGFLPGFQLSGFLFEISNMPKIIQVLTCTSLFLRVTLSRHCRQYFWPEMFGESSCSIPSSSLGFALLFFVLTARVTHKRLD